MGIGTWGRNPTSIRRAPTALSVNGAHPQAATGRPHGLLHGGDAAGPRPAIRAKRAPGVQRLTGFSTPTPAIRFHIEAGTPSTDRYPHGKAPAVGYGDLHATVIDQRSGKQLTKALHGYMRRINVAGAGAVTPPRIPTGSPPSRTPETATRRQFRRPPTGRRRGPTTLEFLRRAGGWGADSPPPDTHRTQRHEAPRATALQLTNIPRRITLEPQQEFAPPTEAHPATEPHGPGVQAAQPRPAVLVLSAAGGAEADRQNPARRARPAVRP